MRMKTTRGRQKIAIKKIERNEDRMITFSKRRQGIYKKLSELATLCGTEIGFLTFSKAGTAFTFGHPSFQEVAQRYMIGRVNPNGIPQQDNTALLMEAQRKTRINVLNQQYMALMEELEAEEELEKVTEQFAGDTNGNNSEAWWKEPIHEIDDVEKLTRIYSMCQELHDALASKIVERKVNARNRAGPSSSSNGLPPNQFSGYEMNRFHHTNQVNQEAGPSSSSYLMNRFGADTHTNQEANPGSSYPSGNGYMGRKN